MMFDMELRTGGRAVLAERVADPCSRGGGTSDGWTGWRRRRRRDDGSCGKGL